MEIEWRKLPDNLAAKKQTLADLFEKYIALMKDDNIKTLAFLLRDISGVKLIIEIEQVGTNTCFSVWGHEWIEVKPCNAESIPDNLVARKESILNVVYTD